MPNGFHGPDEAFAALEAPLLRVDPIIEAFARAHRLRLTQTRPNWPDRSLHCGADPNCMIQLYLADEAALTWSLWLVCSRDQNGERWWRQAFLIESQPMEAFEVRLPELLAEGLVTVREWAAHPETFEFATRIWTPGDPAP